MMLRKNSDLSTGLDLRDGLQPINGVVRGAGQKRREAALAPERKPTELADILELDMRLRFHVAKPRRETLDGSVGLDVSCSPWTRTANRAGKRIYAFIGFQLQ
jgi:hypothetical protein